MEQPHPLKKRSLHYRMKQRRKARATGETVREYLIVYCMITEWWLSNSPTSSRREACVREWKNGGRKSTSEFMTPYHYYYLVRFAHSGYCLWQFTTTPRRETSFRKRRWSIEKNGNFYHYQQIVETLSYRDKKKGCLLYTSDAADE